MQVCVGVYVHMWVPVCVHAGGGQRETLAVVPQVLLALLCETKFPIGL